MKKIGLIFATLALLLIVNATEAMAQKRIVPYPDVRDNDIMWQKRVWREIDFRQKMNLPFYYPIESHDNQRSLINVLIDALKESRIQAYEVTPTGELNKPVPYSKLIKSLDKERQIETRDDYGNVTGSQNITIAFKPESVTRLRIMEDWYFDNKRSQMMVRIRAICPVNMREVDTLQLPNELFWIKFDDSTRVVLSEAPFYNRGNSAARMSYDDVFWKRMFDSYIYKEENVYDRSISDYAKGVEAMRESERIKQEIIDFEQNVWEY